MTDSEIVNKRLLEGANIVVDSIYDLVNAKESYPEAIDVLISLIEEIKDFNIKEGIARALSVKEAKGKANSILLEEYNSYKNDSNYLAKSYCWVIGNAFTIIIEDCDFESILEIVRDKKNGMSRQMFIMALAKLPKRKADMEDVLIELLDSEDVTVQALHALGIYKVQKAIDKIELLLESTNPFTRKSAKKSLEKIRKSNR